jgi:hypothetical protein
MFRLVMIASLVAGTLASANTEAEELKLRVKVALALSAPSKVELATLPDCGMCRHDEPAARKEAEKDKKPLVLIVGKCEGQGAVAVEAGAVACIVDEYAEDKTPRIVVLEPQTDKPGSWFLHPVLPRTATPGDVKEAVNKATPKPASKPTAPMVDWYLLNNANCPTCRVR